jgi:glycosyltransferase involved in cell wall biosynthesis
MKRLLILHPYIAPYNIDLYASLAQLFDLKVVCWYRKKDEKNLGFDLDVVNSMAEFDVEYIKGSFFFKERFFSPQILKIISVFKPDIVIPHEFGLNTTIALALKSIYNYKVFVTSDDSPEIAENCNPVREFFRKQTIKRSKGVIVVHPYVEEYLKNKYYFTNCKYLFFPIIHNDNKFQEKLRSAKSVTEELVERYQIKDNKTILYVGRLVSVKSVDILIKAFNKVLKLKPNTKLIIVGEGEEENNLKKLISRLKISDSVIFMGRLKDIKLYACYNLADIFVLPSTYEPFGAVVNEALISGCITIVSDKVGGSCLLNEVNGNIFKTGNVTDLCDKIIYQLDNLAFEKTNLMFKSFEAYKNEFVNFISE